MSFMSTVLAEVRIQKGRKGKPKVIMPLDVYRRILARLEDKHDAEVARKRAHLAGIPYGLARRRLGLSEI